MNLKKLKMEPFLMALDEIEQTRSNFPKFQEMVNEAGNDLPIVWDLLTFFDDLRNNPAAKDDKEAFQKVHHCITFFLTLWAMEKNRLER